MIASAAVHINAHGLLAVHLLAVGSQALLLVAAGVVGVICDRAYRGGSHWWRVRRPAGKIWGWTRSESAPTYIVIGRSPVEVEDEFAPTVFQQEAHAASEIESYLSSELDTKVRLRTSDAVGDEWKRNLVIIGGPKHNSLADEFLSKRPFPGVYANFTFTFRDKSYAAKVDDTNGEPRIVEDFAFVMKCQNPWNHRAHVLLIGGCRTYACIAGARALTRSGVGRTIEHLRQLGAENLLASPEGYLLVVRVSVGRNGRVGDPEVVAAGSLRF